ncbi:MAG TPA: hypothetical protein DDZ53_07840 [Firmicutes bacterium]|nr:hypothetical protein [Bacillota bacterium]
MFQCQIATVLREKLRVCDALLVAENYDEPLTGNLFRFSGVDLAYLFFELELAFGIRVSSQYLDDYGFCSINRIAETIHRCGELVKSH